MKHIFVASILALSPILTPLQGIHAATPADNTELIQKLLAQIVLLQAELNKLIATQGGNTTTQPTCTFTRTLKEGTQGTDVTCLQTYLKKKGHFGGTATGYYGPQTKNAVYTWQKSVGIIPEPTAIGMFGPRSQETLIKEMRTTASVAPTNTPTTNTTPRTTKGGGGGGGTPRETTKNTQTTPVPTTTAVPKTTTTTPVVTTVPKTTTAIPAPVVSYSNWNTLCAQSGIFVCDDFNDPTKLKGKIYPGNSTPIVRNGLLEFTIPTKSGANAGGQYTFTFPSVGEGKFLAFSYRIKSDQNTFIPQAGGRKEFILWRGSSSCTDLELSQTHYYSSPVVTPYTECGSGHFSYDLSNIDYQFHYPDYDCTYQNMKKGDYSKCVISHSNQWENFYTELQIGTYGQPNSHVVMWHKTDGGAWKRYIDTSTFTFNGTGGFDHFMLTVYMTGKDATIDHPEGKVYYDHLIMSTKSFSADQFLGATGNTVATPTNTQTQSSSPGTQTSTTTSATQATPQSQTTSTPVPAPVSIVTSQSFASQVTAIPAGSWAKVTADNTANDVDPAKDSSTKGSYDGNTGYRSVWEAWNSGAYTPSYGSCGSILYFGGGHMDYYGNQVIALNLCGGKQGGPIWERLSNPYTGTLTWPYNDGSFPDGTPSPPHTYDGLAFDQGSNSLVLINAQKLNTNATLSTTAWLFNLSTKKWSGPYPHKGSMEGVVAFDSKRNLTWFQPSQGKSGELTSFNTKTGAMTYYGWPYTYGLGGLDSMMGYDPIQDKLILTTFRGASVIAEKDLSNPTNPWKAMVQKNSPASTMHGQHTFAWSNLRQAWIVWDSYAGAAVYELKKTDTSASGASEYTWTLLTSASNTVQPVGASTNGSYKKFQIVQTAPGVEVLVGQLQLSGGIKAFRIPTPTQVPTAVVAIKPTTVPLTNAQTKTTLEALLRQLQSLQEELKKLKH